MASNSFMRAVVPPNGMGQVVPLELEKRPALDERPRISLKLGPAPGTCANASFSQGSSVRRYSPEPVVSTNSISIFSPMPSRWRYRHSSQGYVEVDPPPCSAGRSYLPPVGGESISSGGPQMM